jgi:predicted O-linked N-acetylglucosamine transferase (SPINDLY family)
MAMQRWLDRQKSPAFKRPVEKRIRLGVVSADIRLHSVWMALIKGWLQSFDPERFELVVFSLAGQTDAETLGRAQIRMSLSAGRGLSHSGSPRCANRIVKSCSIRQSGSIR